ncbi:MAG: helix-turn-helix domain-containing protein [Bacteriovoracaceae bacterium]
MENIQSENNLLTSNENMQFLKIKMSKFRSIIFRKELSYIKIGRLVRVRIRDVEQWLESNKK